MDPAHAATIEQDVAALRALGYPAEVGDRDWARCREPSVRIPDGVLNAAFFASEGCCRRCSTTRSSMPPARPGPAHLRSAVLAVRGVAWSGAAPIARVEVMINDGLWQEARLIGDRRQHCW
jgi:hypothetical protein